MKDSMVESETDLTNDPNPVLLILSSAPALRTDYESHSVSVSEVITFVQCGALNLFSYPLFRVVSIVLIIIHYCRRDEVCSHWAKPRSAVNVMNFAGEISKLDRI